MLCAQEIAYIHPDRTLLFENISFSIKKSDKVALIGDNGTGKTKLFQILAGILQPSLGTVQYRSPPYYVPQHFGQFDGYTVAKALQVNRRLEALHDILQGNTSEENWSLLNDDWTIEERCCEALAHWNLEGISLEQKLDQLSGGEKTKVFLAGILIHKPEIVLLDEPTNHLDSLSRDMLYDYVKSCENTLFIISHDRVLLELLNTVFEIDKGGITSYGGNYTFYREQKGIQENALIRQMENREKAIKAAKRVEQEAMERKLRQNARGKRKLEKENMPRIFRKTLKNKAEGTTAKLMKNHTEKIDSISEELKGLEEKLPEVRNIKLDFDKSILHSGKILINAKDINFKYGEKPLWEKPLSFQIISGERINIRGSNGSGKSTLIRILLGDYEPDNGLIQRADFNFIYIDQDYTLIKNQHTIYEQAQEFNRNGLEEHEIRIRLNRFLFNKDFWEKRCATLSGGEKMRLTLCCLMINKRAFTKFNFRNLIFSFLLNNPNPELQFRAPCISLISHDPVMGTHACGCFRIMPGSHQ